jgi:hypothetical protein
MDLHRSFLRSYRRRYNARLASAQISTADFFASTKNFRVPPIRTDYSTRSDCSRITSR